MAGNRSRTGRIKGAAPGLSSTMPHVSLGSPRPASITSVAENRRGLAGSPQGRNEALMWGVRPSTLGAVRKGARDDHSSSDEDEVIDELEFERRLIMKMEDGVRERDLAQLEKTARELKGKPGLGPIRKTIKKHIKKLQEEARLEAERESEGLLFAPNGMPSPTSSSSSSSSNTGQGVLNGLNNAGPTAPSMPRIFLEKPTTVIDLMPGVVGWVIGKGGQRIKEMMAASQCRMWVDQDVPPDEPRKLHLMGTKSQVDGALKLVNDLLRTAPILQAASQQKGLTPDKDGKNKTKDGVVLQQCQIVMDCPPHLVGLLIGKKGWTIKKIQQETSAQVSINQNVKEGAPRKIFIAGTQPAVQHAKSMIQEVLSYPGPAAQALLKSPRALLPPDKLSQQNASAQTLAGLASHQGRGVLRATAMRGSESLTAEQLIGPLASLHLAQACFVDSSDEDEDDSHDGPDEHNDGSSLGGTTSHDGTADLSLPLSPLSLGEHQYYHPPTSTTSASTSTSTSGAPPLLTSGSVASLPPGFRLGGGAVGGQRMKGAESWSSGSSSGGYESEEDTVLSPPLLHPSHAEASTPRSTARFSCSSPSPPPLPSPRPLKPTTPALRISLPPSSTPSPLLPCDYGLFNRAPFSPWSPHAPTPSPRRSPATPISTPLGGATLFGYGSGPGGIRSFLDRLGLSHHAPVLEAHGVDMDALRLLKDNHFRALGVPTEDCLSIMDALMTETAVGPNPHDALHQMPSPLMYPPYPQPAQYMEPPPGLSNSNNNNKGWCLASLREGV